MNRLQLIVMMLFFLANVQAQDNKNAVTPAQDPREVTYCALLKDGTIIVVSEGKQVFQDIKLNDGYIIRSNAMLVNDEGTETPLVNGDCVGLDGKVFKHEEKNQKKNTHE